MYILFLGLMISCSCTLVNFCIFYYIYRINKLKYLKKISIACIIFSLIYFVDIINMQFVNIHLYGLIKALNFLGVFFCILGSYDYEKKQIKKHYKYIAISIFLIIGITSFIVLSSIEQQRLLEIIFGLTMMVISIWSFYNFRKSKIGKYMMGILSLILAIIYFKYASNSGWNKNDYLAYLMESAIYTLIEIGFFISYFEVDKKELELKEKRFKLAVESSNDRFWEYDILNKKMNLYHKTLNFFGISSKDYSLDIEVAKPLVHPDDLDNFNRVLEEHILTKSKYYKNEYRIQSKNNDYRWFSFTGNTIFNKKGVPIKIQGFKTDITEIKEGQEKIYKLAYYDQITGLINRSYFEEKLLETINENKNFSVLTIGLNGLKYVNETLGYGLGDTCLKIIGNEIKKAIPSNAKVARFEGNQFVALIKGYNTYEIESICNEIINNISKPISINNKKFYMSSNIGISSYPQDGINYKEIIKNATIAKHKAKETKDTYKFFDNFMDEEIQKKIYLQEMLYEAVEKNQFTVYYQLQKSIANNKFTGAESLVRWIHPQKGLISPGEFIPLAEETGLIVDIGEIVLRQSCYKAKELHNNGYNDFSISVNISDIQLRSGDFVELVKDILSETRLNPNYLILEITESIVMKSLEENINILNNLRKLGIRIALDDFGTGYSSLNYLLNLPIDILKIDKSFIDGITESDKNKSILASIISIAKKIDLSVVVEGVETEQQLDILINLKCDKIQGYLFSKPDSEVEKKIAEFDRC